MGLKVLFCRGSLSRKLMSRSVFLLFLLVIRPSVKEEHVFLNMKFSRRPPEGAQLQTPLADSFPEDGEGNDLPSSASDWQQQR